MDFTISRIFLAAGCSSSPVALAATLFCFLFASAFVVSRRVKQSKHRNPGTEIEGMRSRFSNGGCGGGGDMAVDRQTGASMMEQLVPEITTHALSYLDYPSLCRLSMTNSLMRKAANDDNAWKALYHKDFSLEQDNVVLPEGWKAYYAATRAIVNINSEIFGIIRGRSLQAMSQFWLNADYVKCCHARNWRVI